MLCLWNRAVHNVPTRFSLKAMTASHAMGCARHQPSMYHKDR